MDSGLQNNYSVRDDSDALAASARKHLLIPAQEMSTLGLESLPAIVSGKGIRVLTADGKSLIDGPAGMWCTQIGYGRAEIADAIAAQALRLSYNSPWYSSNGPSVELAARIAEMTPGDLNRVFFTTGGSTAVDTALRFSEFYNNVLGRPDKKVILVRLDGYHGSTMVTAACSGRVGSWPNFDIVNDRISFLSSPNPRLAGGRSEAEFLDFLVAEFAARVDTIGPDRVAAFLAEPIMASGGVIIPPKGYHARIKAICEKHDILYISDEVVTGFGRCGEWFASEKVFGVTPDIIAFAKGVTSGYLPLGGVAISDRLLAKVSGDNARGSFFSNGYTYSGHPVSCAAALANIAVIEREGILEHVRGISGYFAAALQNLRDLPLVADVRSVGLIGAVECMADTSGSVATEFDKRVAQRVDDICYELGLIVRPIGNLCVISPPLIVTRADVDEICQILRQGILGAAEELADGRLV